MHSYTKEVISRGRYAELLTDQRPFSEDEAALFDASATNAYESFRNKAAASRGMTPDQMQTFAQVSLQVLNDICTGQLSGSEDVKQGFFLPRL